MGMTRATKQNRLADLEKRITAARKTAREYRDRAAKAEARADRLAHEWQWVEAGPVIDPLPEPDGAPAEPDDAPAGESS
jgi:hypothetical protein